MQCELVTDFSRLEELSADWKRWTEEDDSTSIFQRWEWIRAFWTAYGKTVSLCSVVIRDGPRTLGVLPLIRRGQTIEFLGAQEADYNDLICELGQPAELVEAALDFLHTAPFDWKFIFLDKVPAHSKIYRSIRSLSPKTRARLQPVFRCKAPTIIVKQNVAGLDALISKKQLERYDKKLQRLGPVAFRHFDTREEAREQLDRFFNQHVTRWAMAQEHSQFRVAEAREFYRALVEEFDPRQDLRFGALEVNSQPIAYHFGFQNHGTLTWYKPSFDVNYWDYCPGDVLLRGLLQYLKAANLNELDFTLGDEPFKFRFANHTRDNYILYVERHPHRIGPLARSLVRHGQHALRKRPRLKSALKTGMRRVRNFAASSGEPPRMATGVRMLSRSVADAGRWIWAVDEVRFWAATPGAAPGETGVAIAPASLDDIVRLSVDSGDFLTPEQLHGYRRMAKQGRRLFIARAANGVFVISAGEHAEINVPAADSPDVLKLAKPVWLVCEFWKAPDPFNAQIDPDVLRALTTHLGVKEVWIYDGGKAGLPQSMIQAAGMEFRCRWVRRSILRRSRHARLEAPAMASAPTLITGGPIRVGS